MQREPLTVTAGWFERGVNANPSEALAWVYQAVQAAYEDRFDAADQAIKTALALSPLDPWQYFFDSAAAHVHLARGDCELALLYAQSACRSRARHAPSLLFLVIAQARLGRLEVAQEHLHQLLQLWPGYSLTRFWNSYPGRGSAHANEFAWALTAAGLGS
jgi:tetratricopeptide (TPR) repeat protein